MKARYLALSAALLASCYDYGAPDSVINGAAVATMQANGVDWASYTTFSVDPSVAVVDATGTVTTNCTVDGTQLVGTIEDQMTARGYTAVAWGSGIQGPDVDLQIKMSATLGSQSVYYPGWCGWYPYYYCYPGWTYAGSYSFGTLVLDMGDLKNGTPGAKLPLVWTSASYGVLSSYYNGCNGGGNNVNWPRVQGTVVRAFQQSPYIKKTP
jgi:hypothetical protein